MIAALQDDPDGDWAENLEVLRESLDWVENKLIGRSMSDIPGRRHYESMRALFTYDDIHGVNRDVPGLTVHDIMQL